MSDRRPRVIVYYGGVAVRLALAVVFAVALATPARAQVSTELAIDRFRLADDSGGLVAVDAATVGLPRAWDLGLAFDLAGDELFATGPQGQRVAELVSRRLAADLVGSVVLTRRVEISAELPLVLDQTGQGFADAGFPGIDATALGDLRLACKLALLAAPLEVAVVPALSLPLATASTYVGERGIAFSPELAVSRRFGAARAAVDLGVLVREPVQLGPDLSVGDEAYLRAGVGYRLDGHGVPAELEVTATVATATAHPFDRAATDSEEILAGGSYDVRPGVTAFVAAGGGIGEGIGTPSWRAVIGVRLHHPGESPARVTVAAAPPPAPPPVATPAPAPPDSDGDGIDDAHDACPLEPEDKDGFEDDDGCPDGGGSAR